MAMPAADETSQLYLPEGMTEAQRIDVIRHHLDSARTNVRALQSRVFELETRSKTNELLIDDLKQKINEAAPVIENVQFWQRVGGVLIAVAGAVIAIMQVIPWK